MAFTHFGGGGFHIFQASAWDGFTLFDVGLSMFVFIMTISIVVFSEVSANIYSDKKKQTQNIIKKSFYLFLLGMFQNNGFYLSDWTLYSILQRLALTYLVISLLLLHLPKIKEK